MDFMNDIGVPGLSAPVFTCVYMWQQIVSFTGGIISRLESLLGYCREWITHSVTISVDHRMARDVLEWMAVNSQGSAQRHTKILLGRLIFNNISETFDPEIKKQTAARSAWFRYQDYPLYFEQVKSAFNERHMQRASSHFPGDRNTESSGDTIRISTLRCFPDSILSDFLEFVQKPNKVAAETKTAVAYVEPKTYVHWDEPDPWQYQVRTSRVLSTIDLDPKVKNDLINTVDQFVAPERAAWYHQRGIPYLFGALFHGEPGTGKSSTAFTLASHLKKTLYTLNMKEVMDEQHLRKLFRQSSAGDIILIEDIDSAGLQREMMVPGTDHEDSSCVSYDEGESSKQKQKRGGITVQGLLNYIDTARNEGVILIMTTNRPDTLDPALVRPGRVDKNVHFDCATKSVAECIFSRMYQDSPDVHDDDVLELAREFASFIPNKRLTPADIQDHLLSHPTPETAVAAAKEWVEEELQRKAAKRNVSELLEARNKPCVRPSIGPSVCQ